MDLKIIFESLREKFREAADKSFSEALNKAPSLEIPVDYFQFYTSVSSVYSSKIEGEDIDFDSYFKHKFLNVQFKPDYTRKSDDLYRAYEFIFKNRLSFENVKAAHAILSANLLPASLQCAIRTNPMFVINGQDKIEYVAADPSIVPGELEKLFADAEQLLETELDEADTFYFASQLHLTFVKIHPFQDGNGRTARLLEKWFLKEKLGERAVSVPLERNYYNNLNAYYANLRKLGLEYADLDYSSSLDFSLMTINGMNESEE